MITISYLKKCQLPILHKHPPFQNIGKNQNRPWQQARYCLPGFRRPLISTTLILGICRISPCSPHQSILRLWRPNARSLLWLCFKFLINFFRRFWSRIPHKCCRAEYKDRTFRRPFLKITILKGCLKHYAPLGCVSEDKKSILFKSSTIYWGHGILNWSDYG